MWPKLARPGVSDPMNTTPLEFARWCAWQIADWERQDAELDDALAHCDEVELDRVNISARLTRSRNQIILDKAREENIFTP